MLDDICRRVLSFILSGRRLFLWSYIRVWPFISSRYTTGSCITSHEIVNIMEYIKTSHLFSECIISYFLELFRESYTSYVYYLLYDISMKRKFPSLTSLHFTSMICIEIIACDSTIDNLKVCSTSDFQSPSNSGISGL